VIKCAPGEYHYVSGRNHTKLAYGQLKIADKDDRHRNPSAQQNAGGDLRRSDDDGGHLIGAMFGGSSGEENLFPQNSSLNRWEGYRSLEREWADELNKGNQVFVCIYTSSCTESGRNDAVYGTYVVLNKSGKRIESAFSFANESAKTQQEWEDEEKFLL